MTSEEKDVIIYNDTRWCYYEQIDSYSWCPDPEYAAVPSTNTGKKSNHFNITWARVNQN